ncbi:MAG: thioredoxin family protein [Opitutales bacterium]|nr:thioredoxin family protein [Opitutales bacterium]
MTTTLNHYFRYFTSLILALIVCNCSLESKDSGQGTENVSFSVSEFKDQLLSYEAKKVKTSTLKDKFVGIYFSASWCPPCRTFSPKLVDFRDKNKDQFEVVFVSSDGSQEDQFKYIKKANMKWLTLPNGSEAGSAIAKKFGIRGIPSLVIVSPDGQVVSKNGRGDVTKSPSTALKSWKQLAAK